MEQTEIKKNKRYSQREGSNKNLKGLSLDYSPQGLTGGVQKISKRNFEISLKRNYSCKNLKVFQLEQYNSEATLKNKIIKKIADNIYIDYPNKNSKSNSVGSLYKLFTSEYFDMNLVIYYLSEKSTSGIVDTIINLVKEKFIDKTFFYIPQLCNLILLKPYSDSLKEFLLYCCIDNIKFSLVVSWIIKNSIKKSFTEEMMKRCQDLNLTIEMTLVKTKRTLCNSKTVNNEVSILRGINDKVDMNDIFKNNVNKGYQITYFEHIIKAYGYIELFCYNLIKIKKKNERLSQLRKFLGNLNKKIKRLYDISKEIKALINIPTQNLFRGIILPFDDANTINDQEDNLIVNFVPEYSYCFNTKERVPLKLVVECVRAYECSNWDKLYKDPQKEESKDKESSFNNSVSNKEIDGSLCDENSYLFNPFGEKWSFIVNSIKSKSPFRLFNTYSIKSFIFKANDDLSQEAMVMQLLKLFNRIFKNAKLPLKLTTYNILVTSSQSGMIEHIPNTVSLDALKKKILTSMNLNSFYRNFFCNNFEEAQKNFVESLAAYSLVSYIINIKDRHNGNILVDISGHIIHIDFGFVLGLSPGNLNFESAPFKLTQEYVDVMDGCNSGMFVYFKSLMLRGLIEARKYVEDFTKIVEIAAKSIKMPCFNGKNKIDIINQFKERFHLGKSETECVDLIEDLVNRSKNNWRTSQYDTFQKMTNNIMP